LGGDDMSNSNNELIRKLRDVIEKGGNIDVNTRDVLLFSAIVDIYEQLEEIKPAVIFYRVGVWFASAIGLSLISLIFALLTGRAEIIFK
jgi:hypothetical protein